MKVDVPDGVQHDEIYLLHGKALGGSQDVTVTGGKPTPGAPRQRLKWETIKKDKLR